VVDHASRYQAINQSRVDARWISSPALTNQELFGYAADCLSTTTRQKASTRVTERGEDFNKSTVTGPANEHRAVPLPQVNAGIEAATNI